MSTPVSDIVDDLNKAYAALKELNARNPLHNDLEAYLFDVAEWGLGQRDERPDPAFYGLEVAA